MGEPKGTMFKKANATLSIRCLVECPHCEAMNDLFEMQALTDDGYIYYELMPNVNAWGKSAWGEIVQCDNCKENFTVDNVEY